MEQVLANISVLAAMPIFNLGLLIDGLLVGSIFALAAYGLALVWGVMNVKNLAQGDFIMIGGYIAWSLGRHGIDPLLGIPVAIVVLWGIGWALYRTVISKVITRQLATQQRIRRSARALRVAARGACSFCGAEGLVVGAGGVSICRRCVRSASDLLFESATKPRAVPRGRPTKG